MARILWSEKYAPRRSEDVVENKKAVRRLVEFVKEWRPDQKPRALLLWGPAGVGKTASVYAVAHELGYDLIEVNASDKRNVEALQKTVGSAASLSSILGGEKRIILVDEVDGISGSEDRGGISELVKILKNTTYPTILTANDPWDPRLAALREYCELVRYNKVKSNVMVSVLAGICKKEEVEAEPQVLKRIAENARGDLRAAINDLQAVAEGKRKITIEDLEILSLRDQERSVFDVLGAIFHGKTAKAIISAVSAADVDYSLLMQWICENTWQHMQHPAELANAYDMLSRADVFLGRIRNRQHWGLLTYVFTLMSAGVSLSREFSKGKFVKYQFPSWVKSMSVAKANREALASIAGKIGEKCHVSTKEALASYLPYLKFIFECNPQIAAAIAKWLNLDAKMIERIVSKERAKEILEIMEE
ncbi:MAG: replication factor C large subunit [Candidatus Freyarchaeota archaeon]|nr:replication factor C large subunit [Candidatus Freyrarchaeum guaymaensis]